MTKTSFFPKENKSTLIAVKNYKNKIKLTIDHNAILYVKSTENYIQLYYLRNDEVKNILIRNTLKTIELELKQYGILRSQRSYLVNKNQISSIETNHKKLVLYLNNLEERIPLSNSYLSNFNKVSIQN